jgi:pSer/pThr/pTyr-binding forkhead associated (FHA) protein
LPVSHTIAASIPQVKQSVSAPSSPSALQLRIATSPDKSLVGKTVPVARYPFIIGRGGSDLDLSGDLLVSRRHAELRYDGKKLVLVDLLSRNGTFLNGERLAAETPVPLDLGTGVRIRIGRETQLILESLTTKRTE